MFCLIVLESSSSNLLLHSMPVGQNCRSGQEREATPLWRCGYFIPQSLNAAVRSWPSRDTPSHAAATTSSTGASRLPEPLILMRILPDHFAGTPWSNLLGIIRAIPVGKTCLLPVFTHHSARLCRWSRMNHLDCFFNPNFTDVDTSLL